MKSQESRPTAFLKVGIVSIVLTFFLTGGPTVIAQQNGTSSALSGRVEDPNGAVVTGAQVVAVNTLTKEERARRHGRAGTLRTG